MYYSPNGARAFVYVGGGDCINWELFRSVVVNPIIPSTLRLPNRNALTQLLSLERKRNNLRSINRNLMIVIWNMPKMSLLGWRQVASKNGHNLQVQLMAAGLIH